MKRINQPQTRNVRPQALANGALVRATGGGLVVLGLVYGSGQSNVTDSSGNAVGVGGSDSYVA